MADDEELDEELDDEEEAPEEEQAPEEEPSRAEVIAPLEDARGRGEGLSGEASETMTVTPDEAEKLAALDPESQPVAGEDYEVGRPPIIGEGAWVRLADTDNVRSQDERVVGHVARVSEALILTKGPDEEDYRPYQYQPDDAKFEVQTRDEYNLTLTDLTREDFSEIGTGGRHEVVSHG